MPKAAKKKYYAVRRGREGPKIYETWDEAKGNVNGYHGAEHKSFPTRSAAESYLNSGPKHDGCTPLGTTPNSGMANAASNSAHVNAAPAFAFPPPAKPAVELSPEQQEVLDKVMRGENVFFTGSAGTGKSVVLREIIRWCRSAGLRVAVTASTGIASVNIGGTTLHSWAGIGLGKESAERLVGKILGQKKAAMRKKREERMMRGLRPGDPDYALDENMKGFTVGRWTKGEVLIIDEISMIDGKLFDKLDFVGRTLRNNPAVPFGGIQLVVCGDFCQLPPVPDKDDRDVEIPSVFAFEANCWDECFGKPICLTRVYRQKDPVLASMLNEMRFGMLSPETIQTFRSLDRPVEYSDGIEPNDLFSKRAEVNAENSRRLNQLPGNAHKYDAVDTPGRDNSGNRLTVERMAKLLDRLVAPRSVTMKIGAQVMLIKNLKEKRLVNGSTGVVIDFLPAGQAHKRGIAIAVAEDASISSKPAVGGDAEVKALDQPEAELPEELLKSEELWPLVRFNPPEGGPVEMLCIPYRFDVMNADDELQARREQVPLILAWAISIHKSQGQTLERVRVDLGSVFTSGQAYVALSRATSMASLEVRNFDPSKITAPKRALDWMRRTTDLPIPPS